MYCIWQKHTTFRYEVWKQNVTDTCSGTSSTRTLALLNLLLTAQMLNHKSRVNVSDHFMDRRTSPKINTGFPAFCLHQILRGQMKFLTYMYLYHLPWLECIQRRPSLLSNEYYTAQKYLPSSQSGYSVKRSSTKETQLLVHEIYKQLINHCEEMKSN